MKIGYISYLEYKISACRQTCLAGRTTGSFCRKSKKETDSEKEDTMLSKHNEESKHQLEMVTLDDLVPADHLVRKIDACMDFEFIYELVEDHYYLVI
jgi:hypothetical protein